MLSQGANPCSVHSSLCCQLHFTLSNFHFMPSTSFNIYISHISKIPFPFGFHFRLKYDYTYGCFFPFNLMLCDFSTTSVNQSFCCCQNLKLSLGCCQLSVQSRCSSSTFSSVHQSPVWNTALIQVNSLVACCSVDQTPLVLVVLCLTNSGTLRNQQSNITLSTCRCVNFNLSFPFFTQLLLSLTQLYTPLLHTQSQIILYKLGFGV